jgi:hypothetical protein
MRQERNLLLTTTQLANVKGKGKNKSIRATLGIEAD